MTPGLAATVLAAACTSAANVAERLTIEDLEGKSFSSLDQAIEVAGCTNLEISQPLSAPWPPLTEDLALEYWGAPPVDHDPHVAVEIAPDIWLIAAADNVVVGGIDEERKRFFYCRDEEPR